MSTVKAAFLLLLFTAGIVPAWVAPAWGLVINEIRIDQPGADRDEFFELAGAPGASLDGLSYLVIGDGAGGSGVVEAVVKLSGRQLSATGLFVAAEAGFSLGAADLVTGLNFENGDNVTHLLVRGFSGALGDDLDADDDGVLDVLPWDEILDALALLDDPLGGDRFYAATRLGPVDGKVPPHVYRAYDGSGAWLAGAAWGEDSPGMARPAGSHVQGGGQGGMAPLPVTEPSLAWLLAAGLVLLMGWSGPRVQY